MTSKIFRTVVLTVVCTMLLSFLVVFIYSYGNYSDQAESELRREAGYLKGGVERYGVDFLDSAADGGPAILWIDGSGSVLFASSENYSLSGEEIALAKESGEAFSRERQDLVKVRIAYAVLLDDGSIISIMNVYETALSYFLGILFPALLLLVLSSLVASFIARRTAAAIVLPINELDLEHPEESEVYEELRPIVTRLSSQNYKISSQISEMKIRENEFNSITKNMTEGMIVIDSRGTVLTSNERARMIFGVNGESLGSALEFTPDESFKAGIGAALSGENSTASLSLGGRHYSLTFTPVSHERRVAGAVIFIIDDTEKEERDSLRREFTSNVSHELKTPLTSISGFAELISSGLAEGEDAKRFASNIHKEAKRLISLVIDIIRITQLDGGEIPYDGAIDVYSVAEDVLERLTPVAENAGVSISLVGEGCEVLGNRTILEEMIYNLTDNAIKYNDKGGYVRVGVHKEDGEVRLVVSDNGIGIPKDKQPRVFERFFRVDKSHSKNIGGTGLGLSIVKHAALYHKATISLESDVGVGTKVTVSFSGVGESESNDK